MKRDRSLSFSDLVLVPLWEWWRRGSPADPVECHWSQIHPDVTPIIVRLFFLLRFNDQWVLFKECAWQNCFAFYPLKSYLLMPIYSDNPEEPFLCSVVYSIDKLWWDNQNGLVGCSTETLHFSSNAPTKPLNPHSLVLVWLKDTLTDDEIVRMCKGGLMRGISTKKREEPAHLLCILNDKSGVPHSGVVKNDPEFRRALESVP